MGPFTVTAALASIAGAIIYARNLIESIEYIIGRLLKTAATASDRISTHARAVNQQNAEIDETLRTLGNSVSRVLHELDAEKIDEQQFTDGASENDAPTTTKPRRRPSYFTLGIAAWILLRAKHASAQTSLTTIGTAKVTAMSVAAIMGAVGFLAMGKCSSYISPANDHGCEPNTSSRCIGNDIYSFDSCGNKGDIKQSCAAPDRCTERSSNTPMCQTPASSSFAKSSGTPVTCGNGTIDPGEDCDDIQLGGADCTSFGFDDGQLACVGCRYDAGQCYHCECVSGVCCEGCFYEDVTVVCEEFFEYGCPGGVEPGNDVSVRTRYRFCSGESASCTGDYGQWSDWSAADKCSDTERCSADDPTCNKCTWIYDVSQHECPTFSSGSIGGHGGGEIIEICASIGGQGYVTVKARKLDGSNFGRRTYEARISAPGHDPCGPKASYFIVAEADPVGIGTDELTFSFGSQWLGDETEKVLCVSASTEVGDFGYDPNSAQQRSWWYSEIAILERTCD